VLAFKKACKSEKGKKLKEFICEKVCSSLPIIVRANCPQGTMAVRQHPPVQWMRGHRPRVPNLPCELIASRAPAPLPRACSHTWRLLVHTWHPCSTACARVEVSHMLLFDVCDCNPQDIPVCLVGMCPIEKSSPEAFLLSTNNIADASGFEDEVRFLSAAATLVCVVISSRSVSAVAGRLQWREWPAVCCGRRGRPSAVVGAGQMPAPSSSP